MDTPDTHRVFIAGDGTAPANAERVEERARQVAGSDGRNPGEVTEADRRRAWTELQEEEGTGPPSAELVETRARELAVIDGRNAAEVTDADRARARGELNDDDIGPVGDEPRAHHRVSRNPAETPVRTDHQVPKQESPDEAVLAEVEAEEGIREAEHERRLEAQRSEPDATAS